MRVIGIIITCEGSAHLRKILSVISKCNKSSISLCRSKDSLLRHPKRKNCSYQLNISFDHRQQSTSLGMVLMQISNHSIIYFFVTFAKNISKNLSRISDKDSLNAEMMMKSLLEEGIEESLLMTKVPFS